MNKINVIKNGFRLTFCFKLHEKNGQICHHKLL